MTKPTVIIAALVTKCGCPVANHWRSVDRALLEGRFGSGARFLWLYARGVADAFIVVQRVSPDYRRPASLRVQQERIWRHSPCLMCRGSCRSRGKFWPLLC
jgi:hypothetical protein